MDLAILYIKLKQNSLIITYAKLEKNSNLVISGEVLPQVHKKLVVSEILIEFDAEYMLKIFTTLNICFSKCLKE